MVENRAKKYYIRAMNNLRLEWLLFSSISAEFNSKKNTLAIFKYILNAWNQGRSIYIEFEIIKRELKLKS